MAMSSKLKYKNCEKYIGWFKCGFQRNEPKKRPCDAETETLCWTRWILKYWSVLGLEKLMDMMKE